MKRAAPFAALAFLASTLAMLVSCTELGAWDLIADAEMRLELLRRPGKRVAIGLSGLAQATTLTDFPILVRLSEGAPPGFSYSDCSLDGFDVVFTAEDGTPLAHELEQWNNPAGESVFWVKVPSIAASPGTTTIYMHWDAEFPLDSSDPPAVWSNGYVAVFHGNRTEDGTGWMDSTGRHIGTSDSDVKTAEQILDGDIGNAFSLTLPAAGILVPESPSLINLGPMTFEILVRDEGTASPQLLLSKGNTRISLSNARVPLVSAEYSPDILWAEGPTLWTAGDWRSIAIVWHDSTGMESTLGFWEGGTKRSSATGGESETRITDEGNHLVIGNKYPPSIMPSSKLAADLDEIRISNVARSDDWMRASYMTQSGTGILFDTVEETP
ncbi:MAG: DUF2341 domain-containing protein [Spirochaetales bacterium]|nr:DUF2341 domain-containing protein [Spirochaetales bacterium]